MNIVWGSEPTSEDIYDAGHGGWVPLDGNSAVDVVVPIAAAWYVEAAVCLLHDDAVRDVFEILIDVGDCFQYLRVDRGTSSQIKLDQTCASLTL